MSGRPGHQIEHKTVQPAVFHPVGQRTEDNGQDQPRRNEACRHPPLNRGSHEFFQFDIRRGSDKATAREKDRSSPELRRRHAQRIRQGFSGAAFAVPCSCDCDTLLGAWFGSCEPIWAPCPPTTSNTTIRIIITSISFSNRQANALPLPSLRFAIARGTLAGRLTLSLAECVPTLTPPSNTPLGKPHGTRHSAMLPKSVCI